MSLAKVSATTQTQSQAQMVDDLLAPSGEFARHRPEDDAGSIVEAGRVAARAHEGQFRRSGEPYITHPVAVATIVAELGLDAQTVAAALLHDAVEDTGLTLDDIRSTFGDGVATVVDGVTKLDRLQFNSKEAQQAATIRKMLVAMAEDWRVLLIKLADRLHNMRTLAVMPEWKHSRSAQETLDIYAPWLTASGSRTSSGSWRIWPSLLCTRAATRRSSRWSPPGPRARIYLAQVIEQVNERLVAARIEAQVTGRPKHLYSIYEKMVVKTRSSTRSTTSSE